MQQKLSKNWLRLSKLGKFFVLYTAIIVAIIGLLYAMNVISALSMDPDSYNCTSDSMMKQVCAYPFESSIMWTGVFVTVFGWPFLILWIIIAITLLIRQSLYKKSVGRT